MKTIIIEPFGKFLSLGNYRICLRGGIIWFSLTIVKLEGIVNKKPKWALYIPLGITYQFPINSFSQKKVFKILHPFNRQNFNIA